MAGMIGEGINVNKWQDCGKGADVDTQQFPAWCGYLQGPWESGWCGYLASSWESGWCGFLAGLWESGWCGCLEGPWESAGVDTWQVHGKVAGVDTWQVCGKVTVVARLEGQQFTKPVENTNMTECISSP